MFPQSKELTFCSECASSFFSMKLLLSLLCALMMSFQIKDYYEPIKYPTEMHTYVHQKTRNNVHRNTVHIYNKNTHKSSGRNLQFQSVNSILQVEYTATLPPLLFICQPICGPECYALYAYIFSLIRIFYNAICPILWFQHMYLHNRGRPISPDLQERRR